MDTNSVVGAVKIHLERVSARLLWRGVHGRGGAEGYWRGVSKDDTIGGEELGMDVGCGLWLLGMPLQAVAS